MNKKARKILDATVRLFLRDGIKKTTMDDIAGAAKASKVTVYRYFEDKDALYLEAGKNILSDYTRRLNEIAASQTPLTDRLYDALDVIAAFTDSGRFALCAELAEYNDAVNAELAEFYQTYRGALNTLIGEGMAAGRMKPGLDREMIFHYVDMGVIYYQQNAAYREKMRGDDSFRQRFLAFFISGIFADGDAVLSKE